MYANEGVNRLNQGILWIEFHITRHIERRIGTFAFVDQLRHLQLPKNILDHLLVRDAAQCCFEQDTVRSDVDAPLILIER